MVILCCQVLLSGLLDNVARRAPAGTVKAGSKLQRDCAYLSCNEAITEPLYIKSSSVLFSRDPQELPEWVVYQVREDLSYFCFVCLCVLFLNIFCIFTSVVFLQV